MNPRPPLLKRLTFAHLVIADVVIAGLLLVLERPTGQQLARAGLPTAGWYALATVLAGAVAVRRLWPWAALALSLAGFLGTASYGFDKAPMLEVALVLYVVGMTLSRQAAVAGLTLALTGLSAGVLLAESDHRLDSALDLWAGQGIVLVGFWAAGQMVQARRQYDAGLREQAERRAQATIDEAHRTVTHERLRIARELHDVVAHSMSVIAVQAGVGNHVIAQHPAEAAKTLAAIETTSRATLREMRMLLGVLREEAPPTPEAEFASAPGLADLETLATRTGRAGLRVELRVQGEPRRLLRGIDLAAYRIVQEALTNVVKHAATDSARARVVYGKDEVEIEVTDDGRGSPAVPATGHGLIGMRERATLYGGEFAAGPLPAGGFRVWARIPTCELP